MMFICHYIAFLCLEYLAMAVLIYSRSELMSYNTIKVHPSILTALRQNRICRSATRRGCRGKASSWKSTTCGLLNCQSVRNKPDQILDIISNQKLDMFVMTETWLKSGDIDNIAIQNITPPNFTFHHVPRESESGHRGGGVAVLCHNSLKFQKLDQIIVASSFEHIAGIIPFNGTCIRIIVIYRVPPSTTNHINKNEFLLEFSHLLEIVTTFPGKLLILGDFNIHWEDATCPEKADFDQLLDDFSLKQFVTNATHLNGHTLDFVITRQDDNLIKRSTVQEIVTDHALIVSSLRVKKPPNKKKSCLIRNIQSINIEKFENSLQEQLALIPATSEPDTFATALSSTLSHVLNQYAPAKTKTISERPLVGWFNHDIRLSIANRRRTEKKWRRNPTESTREQFRKARNSVTNFIQSAKIAYYNESIANCKGDQKKLFNIINTLLHRKNEPKLPSGPMNELVNSFSNYFITKIATIRDKINQSLLSSQPVLCSSTCAPESCCFEKFTLVEEDDVRKIIHDSKNATCELDPLPTSLFKKTLPTTLQHVTHLINLSLKSGTVPNVYKHALVKPLIKKPTLSQEVMSNYRPISNLPFLSKVLEKVVQKQLTSHMDRHQLHEKLQSAYKPCHSTETALLLIQNDLLLNLANKKGTVLVLLDLSAAFDTIDHDVLLSRMQSILGVNGTALAWFSSYLKGRTNAVSINEHTSQSSECTFGVPQGSVLGPVLFTIYTMPLAAIIQSHGLKYHFYADDTQIYISFNAQNQSSFDESIHKMEECVMSIKQWMSVNMLKLNDEKTEILFITSPYFQNKLKFRNLNIDQTVVNHASSARNIGVIIDNTLQMKDQIKNLSKTSHCHLRNIGHIRKFLTEASCATLIHSLISSRIDYCNSLLANLPAATIKSVQRIQNTAARIVSLKSKYDHITPVLSALHWLPVKQRIMFKILVFIFHCINKSAPSYLTKLVVLKETTQTTRSSSHRLLLYDTPKTTFAARAFSIYGPMLFNALPSEIRDSCKFSHFKSALKTFLFKAAYEPNCFQENSIFTN